jgi:hypothetical protein
MVRRKRVTPRSSTVAKASRRASSVAMSASGRAAGIVDAKQGGQAVGGLEEASGECRRDRPAGPPVVTRFARTAVDPQLQEERIAAIDEAGSVH